LTYSSVSCCRRHSPLLPVDCYFLQVPLMSPLTAILQFLMPPSMLLLAVATHVDCYFAAALVCNCENGSKSPTTVTPTVVPPTPRPTVPIPPTTRPTIPPPLTPCFERGIVGRVLLRSLSTVTKVTAVSTCSG